MNSEKIGKQLGAAREAQNLSLEEISRATYIRVHYLQAIEAGNFDSIPSQTQARGFLRTFANYLDLDPEPLLEELAGEVVPTPFDPPPGSGAEPISPNQNSRPVPSTNAQTILTHPGSEHSQAESHPPRDESDDAANIAIYKGIGEQLQTRRELLGLTLDDVERHTRLRHHYLIALEAGDIDRLPSPVQGRGMLNNYAVFLGMDPEPILLRYAEGLQAGLAMRRGRQPSNPGSQIAGDTARLKKLTPSPLRRYLSGDLLFGSLVVIALLAFAVWGTLRILSLRSQNSTLPTPPSIAIVLLSTATALPTETPTPLSPEDTTPGILTDAERKIQTQIPPISGGGVQLYVTIYQRALLRVIADGEEIFFARVIPGSAYTFEGSEQIEFLTSNGAAVQIFFNGTDQGLLGLQGQVVFRIYTPLGIITPTPTITPTPAPTEIPTATLAPTQTLSPNLPTAPTVPALP